MIFAGKTVRFINCFPFTNTSLNIVFTKKCPDYIRAMSFTAAKIISESMFCFLFCAPIVSALVKIRFNCLNDALQLPNAVSMALSSKIRGDVPASSMRLEI